MLKNYYFIISKESSYLSIKKNKKMKKIFIFLCSLVFGVIISFINFKILKNNNSSNNNIFFILVILLIFLNPLIKFFFPKLKIMSIGSLKFYPNLLKKILNRFT